MTNEQIIKEFLNNKSAKNQNNSLTSTGDKLYSYRFLIAEKAPTTTVGEFATVINDFSIGKIEEITGIRSMTTRQHIGLLKRTAQNQGEKTIILN